MFAFKFEVRTKNCPCRNKTVQQTNSYFNQPTASPGISTMASPNKVSPSDFDNVRQPEMAMWRPKPGNTYISETVTDRITIPRANVGFHAQREVTDPGRLRQRPTTGNGNVNVLLANLAISGSRSLSQSFG